MHTLPELTTELVQIFYWSDYIIDKFEEEAEEVFAMLFNPNQ